MTQDTPVQPGFSARATRGVGARGESKGKPNLVDLLVDDAMYHSDSVILYNDKTLSFGSILNKPIAEIVALDELDNSGQQLGGILRAHEWPPQSIDAQVRDVMKLIVARRGDMAFHYDRTERNMLRAAAEIAARQPETAALYVPEFIDPSKASNIMQLEKALEIKEDEYRPDLPVALVALDRQRLRFVISPEHDVRHASPAESGIGGRMFGASTTVLSSHPNDKAEWGATTIHELVHAFDIKNGITVTHMSDGMETIATEQLALASEVMRKWALDQPLKGYEREMIWEWQELLRSLPPEDVEVFERCHKPEDAHFGLATMQQFIHTLEAMTTLDPVLYSTDMARKLELLPIFEEAARLNNNAPLNPTSSSRRLAEFLVPELGRFSQEHYLKPLAQEYQKALDAGEFEIRSRPLLRFNMLEPAREYTDRIFREDEQSQLDFVRNKLQRVTIELDNFHAQPAAVQERDRIVEEMRAIYEKAYDRIESPSVPKEATLDMMVLREVARMQRRVEEARKRLEGSLGLPEL